MAAAHLVARERCPGCGSPRRRTLYERAYDAPELQAYLRVFYPRFEPEHLAGGTYALERCLDCRLIWQREAPDDELAQRLYGLWIDAAAALGREDSLGYYAAAAQEVMLVLTWTGRRPSELSVLDYGMGFGKWARMALAFGCDAYGVELDPRAAAHARAYGVKTRTRADLVADSFDFVNTEQVLEHLADPLETLADLRVALRPDGLLKVSVPEGRGIEQRLRKPDWTAAKGSRSSLNAVAPLEHLNCFDRGSLVVVARAAGLEPVRIPLGAQYAAGTGWGLPRGFARNFVKPLARNTVARKPYLVFRASASNGRMRAERSS